MKRALLTAWLVVPVLLTGCGAVGPGQARAVPAHEVAGTTAVLVALQTASVTAGDVTGTSHGTTVSTSGHASDTTGQGSSATPAASATPRPAPTRAPTAMPIPFPTDGQLQAAVVKPSWLSGGWQSKYGLLTLRQYNADSGQSSVPNLHGYALEMEHMVNVSGINVADGTIIVWDGVYASPSVASGALPGLAYLPQGSVSYPGGIGQQSEMSTFTLGSALSIILVYRVRNVVVFVSYAGTANNLSIGGLESLARRSASALYGTQ